MISYLETLVKRLEVIPIPPHKSPRSCGDLFNEFLRRLTNVYELSQTDKPFKINFFFNDPTMNEIGKEMIWDFMVDKDFYRFGGGAFNIIHAWLYWELLIERSELYRSIKDIELFEPFLVLLERGGRIDRDHTAYEIYGAGTFSINKTYSEPLDMSKEHLDALDA